MEKALLLHGPDLVIVNPLLSYIGGDIVAEASEWMRVGLLPLLQKYDCGVIVCSHTNKMQPDSWDNTDDTYSAIGGSEMANVPRSVLTLRPTKSDEVNVLRVAKRTTTGWLDDDGKPTKSYYLKRTNDPTRPAWLPVTHTEAAEAIAEAKASAGVSGARKATGDDVLEILEQGAMSRQELIEAVRERCGCSKNTALEAIGEAREELHSWKRKGDGPGGVSLWLCLPGHASEFDIGESG